MVLSRRFFATRGVLLVMKTLEDERYVVIKAYKCAVSEIWRDFFCISIYCVYVVSLHTESTDSVIEGREGDTMQNGIVLARTHTDISRRITTRRQRKASIKTPLVVNQRKGIT